MDKIEIQTPVRDKVLPVLSDALERQKRLLADSIARTEERVRVLAGSLQVNPALLLAGQVPYPETKDMDLVELEGELSVLRHLRDQLESLTLSSICE
jgi:hypothetical protein